MDSASARGTLSAILAACVVATACYASFAGRDAGDEGGFDVPAEDASSDGMPEARSWLRRLGEEGRFMRPAALTELPGGDLVLLGYRPDELLAQEVLWAIRLAPDGGVLWQRKFPGLPREFAHGTARRRGGGYLAVGDVEYFTGSSGGAAVFAFNEEGRPQWERTIDQAVELFGVAMQPDGGHVVAGWLATAGPATEWARPWVARTEPDGGVGWQRRFELAGAVGRSVVSTSGGATIAAFMAPTGAEGTWMPVLTRLGDDGEVAWARDVRAEGAMESGVRLADLPDDEMALVWNAGLLVIGEDGTLHRGWRLESPADLVLVDAVAADDGMALVGRDDAGGWVGLVGRDGALRWQAAVAGEVELDYAGVVRSEHDGGLAFFGGTITSTWVLRLRADGRFDGDCPGLSPGEASVVEGRTTLEPRTIDSVETSFDATEESMAVEDDDLAVEVACGEP